MKRCSVADAKAHLPQLIARAERDGRETIIERRGCPVARIVPLAPEIRAGKHALREFDAAVNELQSVPWHEASVTSALASGRGRLG